MQWTPTLMGVPKHEWAHSARLEGWPRDVVFMAPSKIRALKTVRRLVMAVKWGRIYFRRLTEAEATELRARCDGWEMKEARVARNDCGGKHKPAKTSYHVPAGYD